MSEENVQAVRQFLRDAARAPDTVWGIFADEVEFELVEPMPGMPKTVHGPAGVREFFRRWIGAFDDWGYDVEDWVVQANVVLVRVHQWGRGKGSGVPVDNRFWQAWVMRDGKALRVVHRATKAEALEAAGLQE